VPHVAKGAYDPERVQLCVQGQILAEQGYVCEQGELYNVRSKERVRAPFDDELKALTLNAVDGLLSYADSLLEGPPGPTRCGVEDHQFVPSRIPRKLDISTDFRYPNAD
jgi:hypothetical protein